MSQSPPLTLIDKIWNEHRVLSEENELDILLIDRIFLHERTGGHSLKHLTQQGRAIRNPGLVFGTIDHIIDTDPGRTDKTKFPAGEEFIRNFRDQTHLHGLDIFDLDDARQGIVHVVSPEQGIALPGCTLVCCDSHTCTVGGIGALAWGTGSSEVEHALATQTIRQRRPKTMRVTIDGLLQRGVVAKDIILALIGRYGARGGLGYAIEFAGSAVRALPVEGRLTLCNMAVEFGAWTGIVAADDITFDYLKGRPFAPKGAEWDRAVAYWQALQTDPGAEFGAELSLSAADLEPQVTWGTSPQYVASIGGQVPQPLDADEERALEYMDLRPETRLETVEIEAAFIGSCTNSRIGDLRAAAEILRGRKVHERVKAICVPGSTQVKLQAESEGLDKVFKEAGFEWRESGCSLCFWSGGDNFGSAKRVISTTNRNFENRQGRGVRSHLASPLTVAASAIAGRLADPRRIA